MGFVSHTACWEGGQHAWLSIFPRTFASGQSGRSKPGCRGPRRHGVSIASAVRWMDEYLRTGRTAPKPRGGDRRSGRIEAQADLLMRAIETEPDITLAELRRNCASG